MSKQTSHADFKWTTEEESTADQPTLEVQTWLVSVFLYFTYVGAWTNSSWTVIIVTLTTHVKLCIMFPKYVQTTINTRQEIQRQLRKGILQNMKHGKSGKRRRESLT
ncbi:uncharacterized protein LOC143244808 [Tachypleus tridentatus]|uniref:uncharacterized protein LOC143244808 n=1 Tax=Tachypleus tridentatus TaxID=6853 RepID=UPI003FCF031D